MKLLPKLALLALTAFCFAACVVEADDEVTETESTVLSDVSLSGSSSISYNGTATLMATVTTEDNSDPSITYTWEITSGTDYAYFGSAGTSKTTTAKNTATLTANNTTDSAVQVKIKVTATNKDNSSDAVSSELHIIEVSKYGVTVKDELTAVELSSNVSTITATGTVTFIATPTYTGEPTITYSWEITGGNDYAELSATDGVSVKLAGTNTSESEQTVTVQVTASDGTNSYSTTLDVTVSASIDTDTLYINMTSGKLSPNNETWYDITTSKTTFSNDTLSIKYTKDSGTSTGLIKIDATSFTKTLNVYLSGTMTTGGVKIQTNGTDAVNVYLNSVSISSSNYPCIDITKGSAANVYLTGTNTLKDGRAYGTGYGEEYSTTSGATYTDDDGNIVSCTVVKSAISEGSDSKGTLYSKGNLTISETTDGGSLLVTQAYKNCIASKGTLTINSGTYTLTSTGKNGLFADESVVVNDGTITFSGTGTVSTTALRKANGIKADSDNSNSTVYIKGGSIDLTAYNGKGIAASKVYISGGTNTINVTGTSGYTNDDRKTGYYYTADGEKVTCSGGTSGYITCAPEGIEGDTVVEISGGTTEVYAQDDGVNVSSSSATFTMKGGYLYVYATKGDGIDSNGTLTVSDGVIVSYAPTGSEDALDSDSKTIITGGVVAGVCGSTMGLSEYSTSGQKVLYFTGSSSNGMRAGMPGGGGFPGSSSSGSSSSSSSSFSKVAVAVDGTVKYAFELPSSSFGLCVLSCPSFTSSTSSSYTVYTAPTFSGGTSFHGLYASDASETTLPTVTKGSSTATPSIK